MRKFKLGDKVKIKSIEHLYYNGYAKPRFKKGDIGTITSINVKKDFVHVTNDNTDCGMYVDRITLVKEKTK